MGITFQGGYDIKENKLTTSSVSISRDLHCWQMSFSWIPFGPPQLELQHRRQGRIAGRPQIRQEPVDVRQHVLMHGVSPENARLPRTRRDGKAFPCPIFGISTHADHEKVHHLRIVSGPRCRYVLRTGASSRRRLQQGSGRHLSEEIDEPLRTHPQQRREPSLHTGTNPARSLKK